MSLDDKMTRWHQRWETLDERYESELEEVQRNFLNSEGLMDRIWHGCGAGVIQCMLRFFSLRLTVSPWWSLAMAIHREIMAILPWGKIICKRQRPNHTNNRCVFWQLVWSWSSWCWSLDFASLGIQHWFLVNVLRILELTFGWLEFPTWP